ncbi:hypothetical protein GCM10009696_22500 [Kocuria himachalensis]
MPMLSVMSVSWNEDGTRKEERPLNRPLWCRPQLERSNERRISLGPGQEMCQDKFGETMLW